MGSKLFDNILQVVEVRNVISGTDIVSSEIDFELPRGFVAKIHKIVVFADNIMDKLADGEKDTLRYVVLLDPDDALSIQMPLNSVEHDAIMSGTIEYNVVAALTLAWFENYRTEMNFSHLEGFDVISARNMRFNIVGGAAFVNDAIISCQIYYTLEEIKDTQIMELLDIL